VAAGAEEDALETFLSSLPDPQLVVALSAEGAMPPELRLVLGMMHLSSSADAFNALAPIAQQCEPSSFARAAFARYRESGGYGSRRGGLAR